VSNAPLHEVVHQARVQLRVGAQVLAVRGGWEAVALGVNAPHLLLRYERSDMGCRDQRICIRVKVELGSQRGRVEPC